MKTYLFQFCGHCWVLEIWWHIECSTLTASSFRIWNSSTGIPSPPLALFVVLLPEAPLTSSSGCLALGEQSHHCGYLGDYDLFCTAFLCIPATSSNISLGHSNFRTCSSSIQFSSFAQSFPALCDPMNHSTPGFPVQHQLPEFTQTHIHWVGDAIQPSHPLSSPSPPAATSCEELTWTHPFSSVQSLSRVRLFETPWITARQSSLSITNSRSSLRLTSIESVIGSSKWITSLVMGLETKRLEDHEWGDLTSRLPW